jgi:predicted lipoprotein with Yx(FWY)xxD motif
MTRHRPLVALLPALLLVLAGCGADGGGASSDTGYGSTGQAATPAPAPTTMASPDPSGSVIVGGTELGRTLADPDGRTLYAFTKDQGAKSSCYGDCAVTWPALIVQGKAMAGPGVEADWLGTTDRSDGTTQVTYKDMPLYYYAGDTQPGETNGQGIDGAWFVVAPDGGLIRTGSEGDPAASNDGYSYP